MKAKKEKANHKEKKQRVKKYRSLSFKDYFVYLLLSLIMVFLTASFIVEDVYNRADRVRMKPESIKKIYSVNVRHSESESLKELPAIPTEK